MLVSIAVSTHQANFNVVAYKADVAETMAQAAALGYDCIELAIRDPQQVDSGVLLSLPAKALGATVIVGLIRGIGGNSPPAQGEQWLVEALRYLGKKQRSKM